MSPYVVARRAGSWISMTYWARYLPSSTEFWWIPWGTYSLFHSWTLLKWRLGAGSVGCVRVCVLSGEFSSLCLLQLPILAVVFFASPARYCFHLSIYFLWSRAPCPWFRLLDRCLTRTTPFPSRVFNLSSVSFTSFTIAINMRFPH